MLEPYAESWLLTDVGCVSPYLETRKKQEGWNKPGTLIQAGPQEGDSWAISCGKEVRL